MSNNHTSTHLPVHLIIGSQMGAAEYVVDELAAKLETLGYSATTHEQPNFAEIPQQNVYWLVCTSTHGAGDLPDNIQPFITALSNNRPSLAAIKYGIIGLGDKSYDTYCQAADDINRLLAGLGAQLCGELLQINALDPQMPEDYALEWLPKWLNSL